MTNFADKTDIKYNFYSKPNMNYDKLSRALRYYYDKNIMTKVKVSTKSVKVFLLPSRLK